MKDNFLRLVARDLIKTFGANLRHLTIVFPYSAPINHLSNYLFLETNESLTKPAYTTATELFRKATGLEIADNLRLICSLFRTYCDVMQAYNSENGRNIETMSFDEFYQWGEMMLNDFNDIDKALADANILLREVSNIKEINNDNYLSSEQKDVLKKFFRTFGQTGNSTIREKYQTIWDILHRIYSVFNEKNTNEGIAYEGAILKKGLYALKNISLENPHTYVFVGFNAISAAEKELMLHLKNNGKALFYWDYDTLYCDTANEAGRFVREKIESFGNKLSETNFDNLKKRSNIRIIESPTLSGGICYAKKWLAEIHPEESADTVIVAADTNAIPLLIRSLKHKSSEYRIHTKIPITTTAVYASVMKHIDYLEKNSNRAEKEYTVRDFIHDVYEKADEYSDKDEESKKDKSKTDLFREEVELSAGNAVKEITGSIKKLIDSQILPAEIHTLRHILEYKIRSCYLTPDSAKKRKDALPEVKICELSETRMLDFDNVLVVGCNEGNLPALSRTPSLIPNHVRAVYGLPTTDNRSAIGAYNFFRLLQRARNVSLVYTSGSSGIGSKEMSRFILQIIGEDKIAYETRNITYPAYSPKYNGIEIKKTPEMFSRMKHLEATSLYQYIRCPLMFYFSKVARLRSPQPDASKMPANLFGTLFHEAVQLFYESKYEKPKITSEIIERALSNNGAELEIFIDKAFRQNNVPENAIIKKIVKEYFKNILTYDKLNTPFIIQQNYIEKFLYTTINLETNNAGPIEIRIGGKFDRVDTINIDGKEITRVVDYKTSKWKNTLEVKDCETIFGKPQNGKHLDYIFQTFLYSLALSENINGRTADNQCRTTIAPAVFFITAANKPDFDPYITYGSKEKEKITDFSKVEKDFRENLTTLLQDIFNLDKPFKEGYEDSCKFCDFRILCNKQQK